MGATEIDVVINRTLALTHQWYELYQEIKAMKEACGDARMKTILATGELFDLKDVYRASMIAQMAGSDFIKTSTGKETVNATLAFGIVMCRAIRDYHQLTGFKVNGQYSFRFKKTRRLNPALCIPGRIQASRRDKNLERISAMVRLDQRRTGRRLVGQ